MENEANTIITKVEQQKRQKHRFNIFINEAYSFSVHEDVMVKYRLMKGQKINSAEIQDILIEEEFQRAYHKALLHLSRKHRSKQEMTLHLESKGFEADAIQQVIDRLEDQKLLDDALYAEQLTRYRVVHQKKGKRWVKQELKQNGIEPEFIESAMDHIDPAVELESALQAGTKKWNLLKGSVHEKKQKTAMFLARRGYDFDLINEVLKKLEEQ
jgi:regulatory protein